MYDLILKGGTAIDASQKLNGALDLAVQGGKIAQVAPAIPREEARRVIDVPGAIITPGFIDLHAHVFEGFTRFGVNPDIGGVYAGLQRWSMQAARDRRLSRASRSISCRIVIRR